MHLNISNRSWLGVGGVLLVVSVGPYGVLQMIPVVLALLLSFLSVVFWKGYLRYKLIVRREEEGNPQFVFRPPSVGLPFGLHSRPRRVEGFADTRITGSSKVDAPLNDVISFAFRDFIHSWYDDISSDPEFVQRLRVLTSRVIARVAAAAKDAEWIEFLTSKAVDDVASHIKLFRKAQTAMRKRKLKDDEDLYSIFFDLESEMEKRICRDVICQDEEAQKAYLKEIVDFVLFLLLEPKDFHNKAFRVMTKEILINSGILPTIERVTDPEFVNQTLSWLADDAALNNESFLTTVKTTDNVDELEAVKAKVEQDISFHRSRDTGGKGKEAKIEDTKQTLRSLEYLLKVCDARLAKLRTPGPPGGEDEGDADSLFEGELSRYLQPGFVLYSVPLEIVLGSNRALSYFIDFLSDPSDSRQHYVFFYLAVEAFKAQYQVELSQGFRDSQPGCPESVEAFDHDLLKASARSIYDQYLADIAFPRVEVEGGSSLTTELLTALERPTVDIQLFQHWQDAVFDKLDRNPRFYPKFKKQEAYVQLLADFDLLSGVVGEEGEYPNDAGPTAASSAAGEIAARQDSEGSIQSFESTLSAEVPHALNASFEHQPTTPTVPSIPQSRSAQFLNATLATAASAASAAAQGITSTAASMTKSPSFQRRNQPTHFYALEAKIIDTVICNGEPGKASYAVYLIRVTKSSTLGDSESWSVGRRYSDFDDLQKMLKKKFETYSIVLPGKNFNRFSNMNTSFLEKRRLALDVYLHTVLSQEMLRRFLGSMEIVECFLGDGWDRLVTGEQQQVGRLSAAADSVIGTAIKNPFKAVTNTVRAFPLQLAKGVRDVGEGVKEASDSVKVGLDKLLKRGPVDLTASTARVFDSFAVKGVSILGDTGRVGEGLSDEDNIPLRITLLLLDEIFDLGSNQWLRRRMVAFLRQIIKATFGDTINKKIIDHMESYITPIQVAEYVKLLRDSFWPDGELCDPPPPRDFATKQRLRILTKAKMLGSLSDDLKRFIGNDTSKRGILRLFEMFQHQTLNKRLLFVFFEGVLKTIFAANKFDDVFVKIYGHSPRVART